MYRGFNLKFLKEDSSEFMGVTTRNIEDFRNEIEDKKQEIKKLVFKNDYINNNGTIEVYKIMKDWFPRQKYDIFLSHSHIDEKIAIKLAIWLKKEFQLDCFIDSLVWGYSDDLLKEIDNKYCYNKKNKTYYYENRNITTNHVRTILSMSLMQTIDNSECLFFLNTPNSITGIENQISNNQKRDTDTTKSPWIFSELIMSNLIRKKTPSRYKINKNLLFHEDRDDSLVYENKKEVPNFIYPSYLTNLAEINKDILLEWKEQKNQSMSEERKINDLDVLYRITENYYGR